MAAFVEDNNLSDNVTVRALLDVSCLILKNYTKAPWLDTIISLSQQFDDLEILREKASLLLNYTNINLFDSQDHMEVDQDDIHTKFNFSNVLKCPPFIYEKLMTKVGPIIDQMVAEDTTSIERKSLMTKVNNNRNTIHFFFLLLSSLFS